MKRNTIRLIIVLGAVSIMGIILFQIYWVKMTYDLSEKKFDQTINLVLKNVAEIIAEYNNTSLPYEHPVTQISSDYYIVNVNTVIDASILDHYLQKEFDYYDLNTDYEYAIYDCSSDEMVYKRCVSRQQDSCETQLDEFPKYDEYIYYFGIYFPDKSGFLVSNLGIWFLFSFVLLIVIVFFAYALFIILRQKRLSEIQKDFINNMTHEFKTPLSSISISADVLANPEIIKDPQRLANYTAIIKGENERLKNQVDKVLQMASIEKTLELKKERLDLHKLINKVVGQYKKINEKDNIICNFYAKEHIINADEFHLTNIIYNLLDNAIKYNSDDPEVEISTSNKSRDLIIKVKDNGIGIKKEYQKKIFDKFFRVPTGDIHDVKGFGLGLNYVKNIVQAHKWKIFIESEENKGSTFAIRININNRIK